MMLLQLSAGLGPEECCKAVALSFEALQAECKRQNVSLVIIEQQPSKQGYKSLLLQLSGDKAKQVSMGWSGAMLWKCQSPFRTKHKRKNWFFSGKGYEVNEQKMDMAIQYQACRSSGAGGQHVNTTDSAIRAIHIESGISVRIETERSQHANKRLARALIFKKLQERTQDNMSHQEKQRWQQHVQLERGNPIRVFEGSNFCEV